MSFTPAIVAHGGAGTHALVLHDKVGRTEITDGVKAAARAGYILLQAGGSALDAVEEAAKALENNPIFNAGRGSCLTVDGDVEMDASIMDGATLKSGAVGCIKNVTNPIKVARLVMEESDHVIMVGDGAQKFAADHGIEIVSTESLVTEKSRKRLQKFQEYNPSVKLEFDETKVSSQKDGSHDTVGAVAVDKYGNVAYATTTGGINAKLPGRLGDSSIPGCGGYSDNQLGTISTTGHGESLIKSNFARQALFFLEQGSDVQSALEKTLKYTVQRFGGCGGAIALTPSGNIGVAFNTDGMSWASIKEEEIHYGIYQGEDETETF